MDSQAITNDDVDCSAVDFWRAIDIWLRNPHVVNRRILLSKRLLVVQVKTQVSSPPDSQSIENSNFPNFHDFSNISDISKWIDRSLNFDGEDSTDAEIVEKLFNQKLFERIDKIDLFDSQDLTEESHVFLTFDYLIPRNPKLFSCAIQVTIMNSRENSLIVYYKSLSNEKRCMVGESPFTVRHCYGKIAVYRNTTAENSLENKNEKESSVDWLRNNLLAKLVKWATTSGTNGKPNIESLSLIPRNKYGSIYESLKDKYGKQLVEGWPENTDPKKFVYEDLAIAAYLILLWEKERIEKKVPRQTFLDLGCGNGLLVYILTREGYIGKGIDLRKRKIWDHFPKILLGTSPGSGSENSSEKIPTYPSPLENILIDLEVQSIIPNADTKYPGYDWIIGNHSDELTPWIPVFAARSSVNTRYFLLPCCSYEFDGRKYQRRSTSSSQYAEYIQYVKHISDTCGFETKVDRLRIPSTKRICLVGMDRNYGECAELHSGESIVKNREKKIWLEKYEAELEKKIRELINSKSSRKLKKTKAEVEDKIEEQTGNESQSETWNCNFVPREPTEKVRNCTKLDRDLIEKIIKIVVERLLRDGRQITLENGAVWNAGTEIELNELASLIPREFLVELRKENGGLQTLLRNNGHIFKVVRGRASLRLPEVASAKNSSDNRKRKGGKFNSRGIKRTRIRPCWFFANHPDGCPWPATDCDFMH